MFDCTCVNTFFFGCKLKIIFYRKLFALVYFFFEEPQLQVVHNVRSDNSAGDSDGLNNI